MNGLMLGLPKKIKVAAFDIDIRLVGHEEMASRGEWGNFQAYAYLINIDSSIPSNYKLVDTLLHEIGHALYWAYGIEDYDKEERIVRTFATGWTQVYRDNPELVAFIVKTLNS